MQCHMTYLFASDLSILCQAHVAPHSRDSGDTTWRRAVTARLRAPVMTLMGFVGGPTAYYQPMNHTTFF